MKQTILVWSNQNILRPPVKVVYFEWCGHFGHSDRNVPFHLTKINCCPQHCSSVLCKPDYYTHKIQMCGGWDRDCATGIYPSTGHVEFPKFQTGLFLEWKVPRISASEII